MLAACLPGSPRSHHQPSLSLLPSSPSQDPELLLARNGGKAPLTMQSFTKLVDAVGTPPAPAADPPAQLRAIAAAAAREVGDAGVPSLAAIGYPPSGTTPFKGGETAALARMAGAC